MRRLQVDAGESWSYLMQVTRDQMRGTLTFSIETGTRSAWARKA
jgi:hypothetical protein